MFKRFTKASLVGIMLLVGINAQAMSKWVKDLLAVGIVSPFIYDCCNKIKNEKEIPSYYYPIASLVISYYFSEKTIKTQQSITELALKNVEPLQFALQEQQKYIEKLSEKYSKMVLRCQRAEKFLAGLNAGLPSSVYGPEASEGKYEVRYRAEDTTPEDLLKELKKKGKKKEEFKEKEREK